MSQVISLVVALMIAASSMVTVAAVVSQVAKPEAAGYVLGIRG